MNQLKHNRSRLIVIAIVITIVTFTISSMAIASIDRNGIVPPPNLPAEPTELLTSEVSTLPPEVKTAVLNDAVKRTSKTVADLKISEVQPHQWSDSCLGLGKPDEICTQALVSGWRVVVSDGIRNWIYRTDETGSIVRLEERVNKAS